MKSPTRRKDRILGNFCWSKGNVEQAKFGILLFSDAWSPFYMEGTTSTATRRKMPPIAPDIRSIFCFRSKEEFVSPLGLSGPRNSVMTAVQLAGHLSPWEYFSRVV